MRMNRFTKALVFSFAASMGATGTAGGDPSGARADDRIYVLKSSGNGYGELPESAKSTLSTHIGKAVHRDLEQVLKARYLRVLTTKNPYDYYVHNGEMKGVQYEMAREFVKELNAKYTQPGELKIAFEMIPVDFDQLLPMLNSGKGDLIAVGMTRTSQRDAGANFTVPYQIADDVIVTRTELAHEPWQGKAFVVQKGSSYAEALSKSPKPVTVREVDPNLNPENVMELVSLKHADYTLVNSYWAEKIGKRFKNLVVLKERPFRKRVAIRWAVRKRSYRLLKELNAFIPRVRKGTLLGNTFVHKYFDDLSRLQSPDFDLASQRISKYDDSLKKYARKFGFDWRLLAAQCLQESRFEQDIVNPWGAIGLFQIKQSTANEPYVGIREIRGPENYDNNVHAGSKYLAWLKKSFFDSQPEMPEEERLRMTLAAYNAGPSRAQAAIAKAKELGLNPNVWFRNVELAMLELGFPEPVIYVSEINKHYVSYLLMGIK
jgi:membrane-bound lytic murein transglycosylase MltF